jgi:hypothetical protein
MARDEGLQDGTCYKGFQITTSNLSSGPDRLGGLKLFVSSGFGHSFTISTDALGTYNLCNKKCGLQNNNLNNNNNNDDDAHLVCFICDGASGIATCVVDGILCDGLPCHIDGCYDKFVQPKEGDYEGDATKGWVNIDNNNIGEIGGSNVEVNWNFATNHNSSSSSSKVFGVPEVPGGLSGEVITFIEYDRALLTSEAVGAWRAGPMATF